MIPFEVKINILSRLIYVSVFGAILISCLLVLRKVMGVRVSQRGRVVAWYSVLCGFLYAALSATNWDFLWKRVNMHFTRHGFATFIFNIYYIEDGMNGVPEYADIMVNYIIGDKSGFPVYQDVSLLINVLFYIWLIGFIGFCIFHSVVYYMARKQLAGMTEYSGEFIQDIHYELTAMRVLRKVTVKLIPENKDILSVKCPCVIGFSDFCIVLPEEVWKHLSEEIKRVVITHEALHIRKRDQYLNLFLLFIQNLFWFHPLIRYGFRIFRCDVECLRDYQLKKIYISQPGIRKYATAILTVAEICNKQYQTALHCGMLCSSGLGYRVRQIVEKKCKSRTVTAIFVLSVVMLMFFLALQMHDLILFQPLDAMRFGIELPFNMP